MTRRRWLFGFASVLALVVTIVWGVPAVAGPAINCDFDPATCERVVPRVVAEAAGMGMAPPFPLPLRSVMVTGPSEYCLSYVIEWIPFFAHYHFPLC